MNVWQWYKSYFKSQMLQYILLVKFLKESENKHGIIPSYVKIAEL
jgi:hypothetical protein